MYLDKTRMDGGGRKEEVGEPENVNEAGGKVKVRDGQDMKKYTMVTEK